MPEPVAEGSSARTILGFDIGGTKTTILVGRWDPAGQQHPQVLVRDSFPTFEDTPDFEACYERICRRAEVVRQQAVQRGYLPNAISVSIGGPLDIPNGIIQSPPNLPGWNMIPLKELLGTRFGLPVWVEHDGNTGALAEWLFGAGKGLQTVLFLTMGTGFGAGLIIGGRLHRGITSTAGEIGHIRLAEDGPYGFGKHGSAEGFCSGSGMARLATLMFPHRFSAAVTARDLTDLAFSGDVDAAAVIAQTGKYLGRALAVLVDLLNPEMIIIGSMALRLGDLVLQPARAELQREGLPQAVAGVKVTTPQLGEGLQDIAAFCGAVYGILETR